MLQLEVAGRTTWLDHELRACFRLAEDTPEAGVESMRLIEKSIISTPCMAFRHHRLTMDNINVSTTSRDIGNIQEMDMIVGQSHDWTVISSVGRGSDIGPRNRTALRCSE
jgi:hypothetical protein